MQRKPTFARTLRRGKRWREWQQCLREAHKRITPEMVLMAAAFWRWRSKGRTLDLLRVCWRCPFYDRRLHRCGPADVPTLGCRCHMPTKARLGGGCWAVEHEIVGVG